MNTGKGRLQGSGLRVQDMAVRLNYNYTVTPYRGFTVVQVLQPRNPLRFDRFGGHYFPRSTCNSSYILNPEPYSIHPSYQILSPTP